MSDLGLTHLTWDDIDVYCKKLSKIIKKSDFKPEIIVGIHRGGCITAVILSHLLNVEKFCTIGIRSTKTDEVRAQRTKPIVYDSFSLQLIVNKRVLLTDDITDTGDTINEARKILLSYNCKEIKTATLVSAPGSNGKVDYFGKEITPWVVFPWEVKN